MGMADAKEQASPTPHWRVGLLRVLKKSAAFYYGDMGLRCLEIIAATPPGFHSGNRYRRIEAIINDEADVNFSVIEHRQQIRR